MLQKINNSVVSFLGVQFFLYGGISSFVLFCFAAGEIIRRHPCPWFIVAGSIISAILLTIPRKLPESLADRPLALIPILLVGIVMQLGAFFGSMILQGNYPA